MKTISSPVGRKRGRNARNRAADVRTVQELLDSVAQASKNPDFHPGDVDGEIASPPKFSPTVAAILAFQKQFMQNPDGQVDPNRSTLRRLNDGDPGIAATPVVSTASGSVSLNQFVGLGMAEICPSGHANTSDNHCAHFVSHALNITVGLTCHGMLSRKKRKGERASLRVQEVFAACPSVQEYDSTLANSRGLMFVSGTSNFVMRNGRTQIRNVPKKHVGIFLNGTVWHYSNSRNRVVTQTPTQFIKHYSGQKNAIWLGSLPSGAVTNFSA